MKKNNLKSNKSMRLLLPLATGIALMLPACKKNDSVKVNAGQEAKSGKLSTHNVVNAGNADLAFNAYNNAFLVNSGGQTYYKKSISDGTADGTWVASLDILVAEDAYERTAARHTKRW